MIRIAVLLTCFNRKEKSILCLQALLNSTSIDYLQLDVYVVDDGSTDGTQQEIASKFPQVNILTGDGNLFWAGGMRLAWQTALDSGKHYNYYLLLNDDTIVFPYLLKALLEDVEILGKEDIILVGSTKERRTNNITYGGRKLYRQSNPDSFWVIPNNLSPQICDLGNANIMLVAKGVVDSIGILSSRFTHGIADYDYTMRAGRVGISVYTASKYLGECDNDHPKNWLSTKNNLKERIRYLYSHKGLAYHEYLYFIRINFPKYVLIAKAKLWFKTFFPFIWDFYKA